VSPAIYPRGVQCLFRVPSFASARSPLIRRVPSRGGASFQSLAGPSLVRFLLPRTQLRRVPLFPPRAALRRRVGDEDRHALAGAVLRVLAPLDGSGQLAARSRSFEPRRSPWLPTLRGLLSCRSRPWNVPPELSLPEEPYPLSRALASLRVRVRSPPAQSLRKLHDPFRRHVELFAGTTHPEVSRDA